MDWTLEKSKLVEVAALKHNLYCFNRDWSNDAILSINITWE